MQNKLYDEYKNRIEASLKRNFIEGGFNLLDEGMKYSLFAGGKRIRPVILLYLSDFLNVEKEKANSFASSIEMIHTYSLIHDDLPCMDNDTLRRGKPTNHVVYGEGFATLNGDALLNMAFEVMLDACENIQDIKAARCIAKASGHLGMCSGQAADLYFEGKKATSKDIDYINVNKTGALLKASFVVPAILADRVDLIDPLSNIGDDFGRLFQLTDDLLDRFGNSEDAGKTVGKDVNKSTSLNMVGLEETKKIIKNLEENLIESIKQIGDLELLLDFVKDQLNRKN